VLAFRRLPVTVLLTSEEVVTAVLRMALLICCGVAVGWVEAYRAMPLVTCGVAIEVPSNRLKVLFGVVDQTPLPCALMVPATCVPCASVS